MDRRKKNPTEERIAEERISLLFKNAEKDLEKHPERCRSHIKLARKIALRYNIKLGKMKRKYCKHCYILLKPNINCTIRINSKRSIKTIKCLECGHVKRLGIGK